MGGGGGMCVVLLCVWGASVCGVRVVGGGGMGASACVCCVCVCVCGGCKDLCCYNAVNVKPDHVLLGFLCFQQ